MPRLTQEEAEYQDERCQRVHEERLCRTDFGRNCARILDLLDERKELVAIIDHLYAEQQNVALNAIEEKVKQQLGICEKACDVLEKCVDASTWQPIETAPKDGTRILGWAERCDNGTVRIIYWEKIPPMEVCIQNGKTTKIVGEPLDLSGWVNDSFDCEGNLYPVDPTHWMPIPRPPKEKYEIHNSRL